MIFSSAPIWPGERSLSKRTTLAFSWRARSAISERLAAADVGAGVDLLALLKDLADDLAPAVLARRRARPAGRGVGGGVGEDHADQDRLLLLDGQFGSFEFRHLNSGQKWAVGSGQ